ncbi:MAG: PspA/IM30 family protein [Proteobacteria bacterium]|nr:PspA/IM30 family protein [Pseudomonadota bacterium]
MTTTRPMSLTARFRSLIRGIFSIWLRDREHENPKAVYEQAINERVRQYRELKEAVAGILYMRNKLEAEISERRAEIARVHDDVRRAVRRGQDELSLPLIAHKQALLEELERSEQELEGVRQEAAEAKQNLIRFREEIRGLVREKGRMLATLANATARRRMQEALDGLSVDTEMAALESVREHVARVATEGQLQAEIGDTGLRTRMAEIRKDARLEAAREELSRLKAEFAGKALPEKATEVIVPVAS